MKKMLALLAALLMMMCGAALAEDGHPKEDYLGCWTIESLSMGGGTNLAAIATNPFVGFHEDNTVVISLTEGTFVGLVATYENGGCTLDNKHGPLPVVIGADGKIRMDVTAADGTSMSIVAARGEDPALLPEVVPMVGEWKMDHFLFDGERHAADGVGEYLVTVYPDGYALIQGGGTKVMFWLTMHDGRLQGLDGEKTYFPISLDANGMLNVDFTDGSVTLTIVANRIDAAAPPVADVAEAEMTVSADAANPFLGEWKAQTVAMMGMTFTMEEAGLGDFTLRVEQDMAYLTIDGQTGISPAKFESDTLKFDDGDLTVTCTIVDGRMHMGITVESIPLTIVLERVGTTETTPAVETPVTDAVSMADFEGTWTSTTVIAMGMEVSVADAGVDPYKMRVEQDKVYFSVGDDENLTTATIKDGVMTFRDGSLTLTCVIKDGRMYMDTTVDGMAVTVVMDRETAATAEAPVVEEPVVEAPVVEAPVTEAPATSANPFLGEWKGVTVTMMDIDFPVDEVGLKGLTLRVEQDKAYLTMDGEEGSCATTYEGDTLVFTNGTERIVCKIVDGKLHMEISGMTVKLEKAAAAVEEAVTEAPVVEEPVIEEPVTEVAATSANPFLGEWKGVTVTMMDIDFPVDEVGLKGLTLRVEQDMAYLTMDGEEGSCATTYEGDTMVFTNGTERIVCKIVDGKLHMEISGMTVKLEKAAAAVEEAVTEAPVVEEPVIEEPVTEVAATSANPFLGEWKGVTVTMMDIDFPVDEVGLKGLTLRVEQDKAYLTMDGEEGSCATTYEGDTMVFTNGTERIVCKIVDGKLHMEISGMTVKLEKAAAAEAPVTEVPVETPAVSANGFDGRWNASSVTTLGMDFQAKELAMDGYVLVINGSTAQLIIDGQVSMNLTATSASGGLTLSDGKNALTAALAADGTLNLTLTEGGLEYTLHMTREGAAVSATKAKCDFCGKEFSGQGHDVEGLTICPSCYNSFFK